MNTLSQQILRHRQGFTLAELLISLAILGVIATFTIPKILSSSTNSQSAAKGKEAAATIAAAFQAYQAQNNLTILTGPGDLTPYMNYLSVMNAGQIDGQVGAGPFDCTGANSRCLRLHNGGTLFYNPNTIHFDSFAPTAAIWFLFDPDDNYSGTTSDNPGKSVLFFLYADGRITTWGSCLPNTRGAYMPNTVTDPSWFTWN